MNQFTLNDDELFSGETTDFGLPLDLGEIVERKSDEFESSSEEISRCLEVDFHNTATTELEFQPSFGSNFVASQSLFSSTIDQAPVMPFYYKPSRTNFKSTLSLATLRRELEEAFSECSIDYSMSECTYSCHSINSDFQFEVRIFTTSMNNLLVEFQFLDGCRWAFSQMTSSFAKVAQISWGSNKIAVAPLAPLDLDDLAMPELQSSFGFNCESQLVSCLA